MHYISITTTHHLQRSDMFLPQQIRMEPGAHGCEHVIRIHDDVDEGVDHPNERPVAPGVVLGGSPGDHRHHGVVVHVEECNLALLLSDDEEDCVEQLGYLRQEINVHPSGHLEHKEMIAY